MNEVFRTWGFLLGPLVTIFIAVVNWNLLSLELVLLLVFYMIIAGCYLFIPWHHRNWPGNNEKNKKHFIALVVNSYRGMLLIAILVPLVCVAQIPLASRCPRIAEGIVRAATTSPDIQNLFDNAALNVSLSLIPVKNTEVSYMAVAKPPKLLLIPTSEFIKAIARSWEHVLHPYAWVMLLLLFVALVAIFFAEIVGEEAMHLK